jgi:hypothetical protein
MCFSMPRNDCPPNQLQRFCRRPDRRCGSFKLRSSSKRSRGVVESALRDSFPRDLQQLFRVKAKENKQEFMATSRSSCIPEDGETAFRKRARSLDPGRRSLSKYAPREKAPSKTLSRIFPRKIQYCAPQVIRFVTSKCTPPGRSPTTLFSYPRCLSYCMTT